jgi:hypothetical protein
MPEIRMHADAKSVARNADIAVICLPDPLYKDFLPALLASTLKRGAIVVDPWNMVADAVGAVLAKNGVELFVFGRGDVPQRGA